MIDLILQGQNWTSKSKLTPFWACPRDNSSPVQATATQFEADVLDTLVKIPVVLGFDWAWHVKFNLFQNPVYLHHFCVLEIFVTLAKNGWNEVCSTSYMATHIHEAKRHYTTTCRDSARLWSLIAWRRIWHCCIWDCFPRPFQNTQRCAVEE